MPPVDSSSYPRRSRFVYGVSGSQIDLTLSLPPRPWGRRAPSIGGSRTSAAGIPASYVIRRDENVILPLRFFATEWLDVRALLAWGSLSETIEWFPDALETEESFAVYLERPKAGEEIEPSRATDYPRMLEIEIELRLVTGQTFTKDYFDDD